MTSQYLERVVDLTDPSANHILNMSVEAARTRIQQGPAEAVREIEGSFALVAKDGKVVRLARSLDRPMRYFLAKRHEGPALVVAHCRTGPVVKARLEAMQAMFALGLKRCQIAAAFGRDLRRVRSSVIGGPPRNPNRLNLVF